MRAIRRADLAFILLFAASYAVLIPDGWLLWSLNTSTSGLVRAIVLAEYITPVFLSAILWFIGILLDSDPLRIVSWYASMYLALKAAYLLLVLLTILPTSDISRTFFTMGPLAVSALPTLAVVMVYRNQRGIMLTSLKWGFLFCLLFAIFVIWSSIFAFSIS